MAGDAKRRGGRWGLWIPLILFAVIAILYVAFYFVVRKQATNIIDTWIADMRAEGYELSYSDRSMSGFPFLIRLDLENPSLSDPETGLSWKGEALWLALRPWNFTTYLGNAPGRNLISLPGQGDFTVELGTKSRLSYAGRFDGSVERIALGIDDGAISGPDGKIADISGLSLELRPLDTNPEDLRAALDWDGVRLAEPLPRDGSLLGRDVQAGAVGLILTRALSDDDMEGSFLEAWQARGGTLQIAQVAIDWGPVDLQAFGELSRDDADRIAGRINLKINRVEDLKRALQGAGLLTPENALYLDAIGALSEVSELPIQIRGARACFLTQCYPLREFID